MPSPVPWEWGVGLCPLLYPGSGAWVSPLSVLRCLSPRPGMELPAPGIWALGSRLVKSMGFGSPRTRTPALGPRGREAQCQRPWCRGCWCVSLQPPFPVLCPPPTRRSWRWPRPRRAVCWWSCRSCSCCRRAKQWPCAPCRPTASRRTPSPLLLPPPWPRPPGRPGSPAPPHDWARRPGHPLLQPPRGWGTPALLSGAPTAVELKNPRAPPQPALPERRQEDPQRSPQCLSCRYLAGRRVAGGGWEEGPGLGWGPFLSACRSRSRLGWLCWMPLGTGRPASLPWETAFLALPPPVWPRRTLSRTRERPTWRPALPRKRWPRGCPVPRPAVEETQGLG